VDIAEITTTLTRTQTVRTLVRFAEDTPVIPRIYSPRQRWRPTRLSVTWVREQFGDGEWGAWLAGWITAYGVRVRNDGSDGADVTERLYGEQGPFADTIKSTHPGREARTYDQLTEQEGGPPNERIPG
jgi:hypothetical protein